MKTEETKKWKMPYIGGIFMLACAAFSFLYIQDGESTMLFIIFASFFGGLGIALKSKDI